MTPDVTPIPKPEPKEKTPYRWPKRKRMKQVSDKRAAEKPERDLVREAVLKRDKGRCRIAPFLPDTFCLGPMTVHHLQKASEGGPYTEANLIAACAFHNDWVEDHDPEAEALGLVIRTDKSGRKQPWPPQPQEDA